MTTKTLNPLHFEDLEPHRFEDLVRQLIYDFKCWRSLEPTGRLGMDDGYDARGFEMVDGPEEMEREEDEEGNENVRPQSVDRLWQIQCKREKTITPSKLGKYLDEMIPRGSDVPYGVVFAAACDFSKQTQDLFREKLREKGVQEFVLWGKATLEDMLFLPKNDNILFAYFGISLVIRRRTVKTQLRSLLVTKRKTLRHLGSLGGKFFSPILIRDINDKEYPYIGNLSDFEKSPPWKIYYFLGHEHDGIRVLARQFPAYWKVDYGAMKLLEWDYTSEVNLATYNSDPWVRGKDYDDRFRRAHDFLDSLPEVNQAFFNIEGIIPYESIVEIDHDGDTLVGHPHVYVEMSGDCFWDRTNAVLVSRRDRNCSIDITRKDDVRRVKHFPDKLPKANPILPLPSMGLDKDKKVEQPAFE